VRHYIRVTAGPYAGQIYQFATKKDALALESALHRLRPHSTDYGNDRDGFPETHLMARRASTRSPLRAVREQLRASGRAHATIASGSRRAPKTKLVYVVQGNYGYGHGWEDLTAEESGNEAKARLREYRENEHGVPFRLIRRRERIEGSGTSHARRKKLDPREAKQRLKAAGIDFSRDPHELSWSQKDMVLEAARESGYRKRKDAPGSTARMFYQYLKRLP
jgi:hypothetical protein